MKDWYLFLDDERYPADNIAGFPVVARNVDDALYYIKTYGIPHYMSLDHDLGYGKQTGMDFLKNLSDYMMDNGLQFPQGFKCYVHSQNPVGCENMRKYVDNMIKNLEMEF